MDKILAIVKQYWGYDTLRPLQHEAMTAAVQGRDCLAVLPTGGGKSLCYQAPAMLSDKLTVVVSPLIALMKDQVDSLNARGISAAFLNSSLDAADKRRVATGIRNGQYKRVFVAPERFASEMFTDFLESVGVGAFAIDEAHCISHWGHDFREDYRRLGELKRRFPQACVHAFTATATPQVREDIVAQLGLNDPLLLVGDFFRPNLRYRVQRRSDAYTDVLDAIRERKEQAGIVYCIRRDDVDDISGRLKSAGIRAIGYHAGMGDEVRTAAQDAFAAGDIDVVVATVAFGMGIDRSDIRFVIHAAMPKSIEHYQQETGRAGRDGQPADCILFYSGQDRETWEYIIEKNATSDTSTSLHMLEEMYHFCRGMSCRHRKLVTYFGQKWERDNCGACDVCGGSVETVDDGTIIAQKIMSAVVRTGERYGPGYVSDVLLGDLTDKVQERGHEDLSVFGLMADCRKPQIMTWIDQLRDQGCMVFEGEYRVLKITPAGWQVLRSQADVKLTAPQAKKHRRKSVKVRKSSGPDFGRELPGNMKVNSAVAAPLDAVSRALYDRLRILRREIAEENNTPAFMVFSDKTLREIARAAPTTESALRRVKGVGPAKVEAFGDRVLAIVRSQGGSESDTF